MLKIEEKVNRLPKSPGIYLFYNSKKELLYVGKATSLRDRVRSYFRGIVIPSEAEESLEDKSKSPRDFSTPLRSGRNDKMFFRPIEEMIHEVVDIKHIETDSVLEAIILEANYIKKYQPKYNVDGRDDKSWNYLYLTKEDFPKLKTVRQRELEALSVIPVQTGIHDGSPDLVTSSSSGDDKKKRNSKKVKIKKNDLFGPYPGVKTKEMMQILHKLFQISRCEHNQGRPCFDYQIGQCLGVCVGEIKSQEYDEKVVKPLKLFLQGNKKRLITSLTKEMEKESKKQNFEEAKRLRDQIKNLQKIQDVALLNKEFFNKTLLRQGYEGQARIEGYDISNLGETGKVGSMVVFDLQGPRKSDYRKFKIKTVKGQSDVDCLEEVITRRLKHDEWPLPYLFLIDGGKPQVNAVAQVLHEQNVDIPVLGIAKGVGRKKNEFIYDRENKKILDFIKDYKQLFIQVRDEAHRFAIAYQRKLREIK